MMDVIEAKLKEFGLLHRTGAYLELWYIETCWVTIQKEKRKEERRPWEWWECSRVQVSRSEHMQYLRNRIEKHWEEENWLSHRCQGSSWSPHMFISRPLHQLSPPPVLLFSHNTAELAACFLSCSQKALSISAPGAFCYIVLPYSHCKTFHYSKVSYSLFIHSFICLLIIWLTW